MSTQTTYKNGQKPQFIVKEVLRVYRTVEELSRVLLVTSEVNIELTTAFYTESYLYAFLKVHIALEETWVADIDLLHPGLNDEHMDEAFADAVLDEAEYWANLNAERIAIDYQDFDWLISLVEKDGQ